MLDSILPLLICSLCNRQLEAPTTLHCGHTVCIVHLHPPLHHCPVPRCTPNTTAPPPNIPSSSTVAFYPAPATEHHPPPDNTAQPITVPRIDVTVTKVLDLVSRVHRELQNNSPQHTALFPTDSDNSDDDSPLPPVPSSSSSSRRRRSRSADSHQRPRKRRRHLPSPQPDDDQDDDTDGDLLSHLLATSARQRSTRHDQPLLPPDPPSAAQNSDSILARFEKDLLTELTCEICFTLFYDPITTPCFLYFQEHPPNQVVLSLLLKAFPAPYRERGEAIEAEERDARLDTPIFVCQLSFPGMPTLLHFFEPRYRLMLRRCLESPNPCFGMVMPPKPGTLSPHLDYGTMLEIRSVQMQPDGRSLVETWGTYRFRVLEIGTLDGYMVGRIERIDDYPEDITERFPAPPTRSSSDPVADSPDSDPVPSEAGSSISQTSASPPGAGRSPSPTDSLPAPEATPSSPAPPEAVPSTSSATTPPASTPATPHDETPAPPPPLPLPNHPSNSALMDQCRAFLDQLERGTAPWIVQRLSSTYGRMPTEISSFSYWVASILPIDDYEKAKLLPIRSPRLRLLLVAHWIEQLNNNWYNAFFGTVRTPLLLIGFLFFFFFFLPVALGIAFERAPSAQVVLQWMWHRVTPGPVL
ncbi:hypothetical protein C0991_001193 [Blastosporella zonata]|nr:hypothetical protein C0991_001193 [Blastosporella zonata]